MCVCVCVWDLDCLQIFLCSLGNILKARLDLMMEVERQRAIQMYEEREEKQHLQRLKGAELIQQQIRDNETQRILDAEKKQQETQAMLK